MKIAVSTGSNQDGLTAVVDSRFGRSPYFALIDTESMDVEFIQNSAAGETGGAGVMAAQLIRDKGVEAVISGNFGPKAFRALAAAKVDLYSLSGKTVKEAVEVFKQGGLKRLSGPTR